jgi:hypothetical protein
MAPRSKRPNDRLRALIDEAKFSRKGLARRVVTLGEIRGRAGLKYNHSSVDRWLRGEVPQRRVQDLIAEVLSVQLARRVTPADLGFADEQVPDDVGLRVPSAPSHVAQVVSGLSEHDLEQRRSLINSGFDLVAYGSAALRWMVAPRTALKAGKGHRGIGPADVGEIREAIKAFRVLDNRLGGGRIRPTVVRYLHDDIAPLLGKARCTEDVRRSLFSAAAELAQLCGWQAHDLEMQGLAQRYLVQALTMARFAENEGLGGEILAAMSQQAVYVVQPDQAIDLAHAGQAAGRRAKLPVLQTESMVLEAHGHALRNDAASCSNALRRAEAAFSLADGDEQPAWLDYFDEAYFAAKIAHCFHALGQGVQIEKYALRSLDMDPRYVRGKAFNVALLAMGYAVQGELEEACARGKQAVDLSVGIDSARAVTYIRNLLRELERDEQHSAVRELKAYAERNLPALRPRAALR